MLRTRTIPVLLIKNKGLYKGVKFKKHKYVGDPINTVKIFNEKEVDELVLLDIESSINNKPIDFDLLKDIATEAFMPIAYGGGIRSIEDATKIFSIGIEKIVLNTFALENTSFISELVNKFGSQSIIFSLDIKKNFFGKYNIYSNCGTKKINQNPLSLALKMEKLGVGEILLNSIDRDGTMKGYDLNILSQISKKLKIPTIIAGGASKMNDFSDAKKNGAHAVAASSIFIYHGPHKAVLISYPSYEKLYNLFKEN